ncbi:hypothetical protein [Geminocystis sp. NIES-3709]|uniref:hypothetical protein n=1 Tax=Geminocystis sp. NIES-3709 TaxID=1617448 RepID=UPI0005FC7FC0|nr:hypothetical protein [Geminocystis sp. NIES-3709]BAQ65904.1 hypothetical protein GM3709_2669 [Geminocystis sp. NIES-3709]
MKYLKQLAILTFSSLVILSLFANEVKSIPPQEIFPHGIDHLENIGGDFLPLNSEDSNLDEGSYWYDLYQDQKTVYLILQKLKGRNPDGTAIFEFLDVVIIPELINKNIFGIMRETSDWCQYPNNKVLEDINLIIIVKYNKDTATPIKSFRVNFDKEKWEKPSPSIIKDLTCELPYP